MHNRITYLINNCSVKLCLLTWHIKFHLLSKFLVEISYHSWILGKYTLNRHHPNLHNWLMKVSCYSFKIFNLFTKFLINRCCTIFWYTGWYKPVLCNNKFADKIHKNIKFFNVYTYCVAHCFACLIIVSCRSLLLCRHWCRWFCLWLILLFFLLWCILLLFFIIFICKRSCYSLSCSIFNFRNILDYSNYWFITFFRYNNNAEIKLEFLIFNILCRWLWFDNITMTFKILKYKKCSGCLKNTVFINTYFNDEHIHLLLNCFVNSILFKISKYHVIISGISTGNICAFFFLLFCRSFFLLSFLR